MGRGSVFSLTVPRYFGELIALLANKTWAPVSNLNGVTVLYLENSKASRDALQALRCEIQK